MSYINKKKVDAVKKHYNPVDWFNEHGDFVEIFANAKNYKVKSSTEAIDLKNNEALTYENGIVKYCDEHYTLFQLLTIVCFNYKHWDAQFYIEYRILKKNIPYIRVGGDYYRVIIKDSRYGIPMKKLKTWKKETIIDDHGKELLKDVPKFHDFTIIPDNIQYQEWTDYYYNLYAEFPHKPSQEPGDFTHIRLLLNHIFGEQIDLGMIYMKVLYEMPTQILPIVVLVSTERHTGKTTFLNLLDIIFGDNFVLIKPEDLHNSFNHIYATKNIIGIDETVIEKTSIVEKLKAISTQKTMTVNQKHVSQYSIPFFGKIVMATNKEDEFMKIDDEEIRFWVRKVNSIQHLITDIEDRMKAEVPHFLHYLQQLPAVDLSKSRMVFTNDQIATDKLQEVKDESRQWLMKDLGYLFGDYFLNNSKEFILCTPKDIKDFYFKNDNRVTIHFIAKTMAKDFKFTKSDKTISYHDPFSEDLKAKVGYPYTIYRGNFVSEEAENEVKAIQEEQLNDPDLPF